MLVEVNVDQLPDLKMIIDLPIIPNVGDEFTINKDNDVEFYKVLRRDFIITNGKFDRIILWIEDL